MTAALAAQRQTSSVTVVSNSPLGASSATTMAGGGITLPSETFTPEEFISEVMRCGADINDRKLVKAVAETSPTIFKRLCEEIHLPIWKRDKYTFGIIPDEKARMAGYHLASGMAREIKAHGIRCVEDFTLVDLILDDDTCVGCLGISDDGTLYLVRSKSVVLATGGYAGIYLRNDNPPGITGNGLILAFEAGAQLRDMEFIQFVPGFDDPQLPETIFQPPPFPAGLKVVNSKGDDIFRKHFQEEIDLNEAILRYRDRLTLALKRECDSGESVMVEFSGVNEVDWNRYYCLKLLSYYQNYERGKPIGISPIAHFTMGGVVIDERARTSVKGLFAAGEVAGGLHGANRMSGVALTECLVFGEIAGKSASEYSKECDINLDKICEGVYEDKIADFWALEGLTNGKNSPLALYKRLQRYVWTYLSPIREATSLKQFKTKLEQFKKDVAEGFRVEDVRDLKRVIRLRKMLALIDIVRLACELREESRGGHYRSDYPAQNDEDWRKSIFLEKKEGKLSHYSRRTDL